MPIDVKLLHLCDSLFPLGGFGYSDGLEAAITVRPKPDTTDASVDLLRAWLDVCLDETIGRFEGPAVGRAWDACTDARWDDLVALDEAMTAMRPASAVRTSTRAMGLRLAKTWQTLYPDARLRHALDLAASGAVAPTLPVAFGIVCRCADVDAAPAMESYAYTRLASTISAAMRLMPIGQTDGHRLLARALDRVPRVVRAIVDEDRQPESFAPMMDIAAMTQPHLHSRLFRS